VATWAGGIVGEIELGDARLNRRLVALVEAFAERPGASIPEACENWNDTRAAYLFFDNEAVEPEAIIASAAQATINRCRGQQLVLAVQDTTSLDFTNRAKAEGLGPLETSKRRGLFVHSTLAISSAGVPLGLLAQEVWARDPEDTGKRERRKELLVEAKESAKWLRSLKLTEQRLHAAGVDVLTVADREADVYELFAMAEELDSQWLIRARHDRKLEGEAGHLLAKVESAPAHAGGTIAVSRVDDRPARQAQLEVRWTQVVLQPPARAKAVIAQWWAEHPEVQRLAPPKLQPVTVGVILVTEVDAPVGSAPLRWLLLTSMPTDTLEQALLYVSYYRLRWLVERYHYVLKSGCQIERLQLEKAERLLRALAVYAIVAWRLLWLTYEVRAHPQAPCTSILSDETWQLLGVLTSKGKKMPSEPPDLHTAVRQIAQLGGFLGRKHDGEPGVKTLWRGIRRLNDMLLGYRAMKEHLDLLSG
jgi:hypothetical protein